MKMVRVTKKVSQPAAVPLPIIAPPEPVAARTQTLVTPPPAQQISQARVSTPLVPSPQQLKPTPRPVIDPAKPAKPKATKEVYYNIVGEPINPTEDEYGGLSCSRLFVSRPHGNVVTAPVPPSVRRIPSAFPGSGFFLSGAGLTTCTLIACSSCVMRVRRFSSPLSKTLRTSALAL